MYNKHYQPSFWLGKVKALQLTKVFLIGLWLSTRAYYDCNGRISPVYNSVSRQVCLNGN